MKVLHLIARMNVGGTARYLSMLSNGLEANGVESSIATGYVQGAEAEDPSVSSVKLHRIAHLGRAINPLNDYRAMQEFKDLVALEKPDIIHSHTFKAGLVARIQKKSLIKAAGKEIKFVHTFHGHLLDDPEFSGLKKFDYSYSRGNIRNKNLMEKLISKTDIVIWWPSRIRRTCWSTHSAD